MADAQQSSNRITCVLTSFAAGNPIAPNASVYCSRDRCEKALGRISLQVNVKVAPNDSNSSMILQKVSFRHNVRLVQQCSRSSATNRATAAAQRSHPKNKGQHKKESSGGTWGVR